MPRAKNGPISRELQAVQSIAAPYVQLVGCYIDREKPEPTSTETLSSSLKVQGSSLEDKLLSNFQQQWWFVSRGGFVACMIIPTCAASRCRLS